MNAKEKIKAGLEEMPEGIIREGAHVNREQFLAMALPLLDKLDERRLRYMAEFGTYYATVSEFQIRYSTAKRHQF